MKLATLLCTFAAVAQGFVPATPPHPHSRVTRAGLPAPSANPAGRGWARRRGDSQLPSTVVGAGLDANATRSFDAKEKTVQNASLGGRTLAAAPVVDAPVQDAKASRGGRKSSYRAYLSSGFYSGTSALARH